MDDKLYYNGKFIGYGFCLPSTEEEEKVNKEIEEMTKEEMIEDNDLQ